MKKSDLPKSVFNRLCVIQRHLKKWAEDECNGFIQWQDQECTIPTRHNPDCYGGASQYGRVIVNKEAKYLKEAESLASQCGAKIYHQGDPRGCVLYIYRDSDLEGRKFPIESCYSSAALACVKEAE